MINDMEDCEFTNISFKDFELDHPIVKILIHNNDTFFRECLCDIISKVYNPDTLLSHIDDVKNLISSYVKKGRDSGAGKINKSGKDTDYSYEHFLQNTEYAYLYSHRSSTKSYGLKDLIRRRYNYAAAYYGIDKNHKLINPRPVSNLTSFDIYPHYFEKGKYPDVIEFVNLNQLPEYTPNLDYEDDSIPTIGINAYAIFSPSSKSNSKTTSSICWSKTLGYQCCSRCNIIYEDNDGSWGFENGKWCGITSSCLSNINKDECFSITLGFSCCSSCNSYFEDEYGKWGVENNNVNFFFFFFFFYFFFFFFLYFFFIFFF